MKNPNNKKTVASVLSHIAQKSLISSANSRCVFVFHQPKQPKDLKRFRKF